MRATSPPGSTIAARLVAVHATIEQFCANGVTGTMVTFRGCMGGFTLEGRRPSYSEAALRREGLERGFGPCAEMLDHFGRRNRPKPRAIAVILVARQTCEKARCEKIACARRVDEFVDRRGGDRVMALARDHDAAFLAARHGGELHFIAQRCDRGIEVGGLVEAFQLGLVG